MASEAGALRAVHSRDVGHATELREKASSGALTSYDQPAGAQVRYRAMSVDQFAKVSSVKNFLG